VTADKLYIDEVIATYLKDYASHSRSREFLVHTATPIAEWWTGKTLAEVNGTNCRRYVTWRMAQPKRNGGNISEQTARHDLKTLRAAKAGERTYCIIAEWSDMDALANARPQMIATLDSFRDTLEDLGGGLGVTDPVAGPVVLALK
jgi:hypothetical protein